jgi:hypothetical protein
MSDYSYDYSVLVVAEPDFVPTVKDKMQYFSKLTAWLTRRTGDSNLRGVSVTGRYGVDMGGDVIEVDDKNKTAFIKSLDDHLMQFNEFVIIANYENDAFVTVLTNRLTELSKPFTIYGYETRKNETP